MSTLRQLLLFGLLEPEVFCSRRTCCRDRTLQLYPSDDMHRELMCLIFKIMRPSDALRLSQSVFPFGLNMMLCPQRLAIAPLFESAEQWTLQLHTATVTEDEGR